MLIPTPKGPTLSPQLKQQEQDNPYSSFGRYGLYRALLRAQNPSLRANDPIAQQLNQPLAKLSLRDFA